MDETRRRLTGCFQVVFPDLPESSIPAASQSTVADWDSVAAITLVNVVEEEFGIELDPDDLAELDSFEKVCAYVDQHLQVA